MESQGSLKDKKEKQSQSDVLSERWKGFEDGCVHRASKVVSV